MLGEKTGKRASAGQTAPAALQRRIDIPPRFIRYAYDGSGLSGRPAAGASLVLLRPSEDPREGQRRQLAHVPSAPVLGKQRRKGASSGESSSAGAQGIVNGRPRFARDLVDGPPFLPGPITRPTAVFIRPVENLGGGQLPFGATQLLAPVLGHELSE